jgi:hypothetical protein
VVGLFPTANAADAAAAEVRAGLPYIDAAYTRFFGEQWLFAADDTVHAEEPRALAMSSDLPVDGVVALIRRFGGLAIAAHIDRPHFGVIGQLGFFPYDAGFDAIELSRHAPPGSEAALAAREHHLPMVHSSDAHYLDDLGCTASTLVLREPTFADLGLALRSREGRGVLDA